MSLEYQELLNPQTIKNISGIALSGLAGYVISYLGWRNSQYRYESFTQEGSLIHKKEALVALAGVTGLTITAGFVPDNLRFLPIVLAAGIAGIGIHSYQLSKKFQAYMFQNRSDQ